MPPDFFPSSLVSLFSASAAALEPLFMQSSAAPSLPSGAIIFLLTQQFNDGKFAVFVKLLNLWLRRAVDHGPTAVGMRNTFTFLSEFLNGY
ncbi:hypothetical protein SUGI_0248130 [Cryptomeria japonica]|nr:hypothetical protein SUGI_0248130 [Cryptomeria japonica]